jgi:Transposase
MLCVGLDLSRKSLDWHALLVDGESAAVGACPPDGDGLAHLVRRLDREQRPVLAAIESMTGARFVHDRLELAGWDVRIADAQRVKGLAPLACKTDRIDAWVLAELARRDLVPEVWLPDPAVRAERERARFRLFLVRKRTALKNRVHAILFQHGLRAPVVDLFGVEAARRARPHRARRDRRTAAPHRPLRTRGTHTERAARRGHGRRGAKEPRHRPGALRHPQDGGGSPLEHLPQAGNQFTLAASPRPRGAGRGGAKRNGADGARNPLIALASTRCIRRARRQDQRILLRCAHPPLPRVGAPLCAALGLRT